MDNQEGQRLVPQIAEQLIIELFAGQTAQLQEIKTEVEEVHAERGGLPPTVRYSPVSSALSKLKESGIAENPQLGYWSIRTYINKLEDFIKWANRFEEGQYVFRGVPNETYKIQASAFRRPDENDRDFEKFLRINQDLIREAKQRGYDKKNGMIWNGLDILAELQHFRAATCLIDFTYSAQIAL